MATKPQDKEPTPQELAEAGKAQKRLLAWLESQKPTPPNKKEIKRMEEAIAFDFDHMRVYLGQTVKQRLAIFELNGYLYDGISVEGMPGREGEEVHLDDYSHLAKKEIL
jgi:hypothetical protein